MAEIHVTGLYDLQRFLDEFPVKMEKNIMRGALRAGVKAIAEDAKKRCPDGPPSATGAKRYKLYEGALRDSIRVSVRAKGGTVTASVKAGGKLKNGADVWYAYIIEYTGAAAHVIKAKPGSVLNIGGGLYKAVDHPGMDAISFLRPALDANATQAVVAAGNYIKNRLANKLGLDTSDITVEAES